MCYENYILSGIPLQKFQNSTEFQYLVIFDKIVLIFNQNINIGILNKKSNEFIPEMIIKFDSSDNLENMIAIMSNYGFQTFETKFNSVFEDSNNFIKIIKSKEKEKKDEKSLSQINEFEKLKDPNQKLFLHLRNKLLNNLDINKSKKSEKETKNKKNHAIENILSVLIDSEIIKEKLSNSIKEGKEEKYYLLNYSWFKKYIKSNQVTNLFESLINIVKSYINGNLINKVNKKEIISEIIKNLDTNIPRKITNTDDYNSLLNDKKSYKAEFDYIRVKGNEYFTYYKNFILISLETKNSFTTEFYIYNKFNINDFSVYIGSGQIFLINQSTSQNIIEIGFLDNNYVFKPKMFFKHNDPAQLTTNINLLLSNGFTQYQKYYLMFNEDKISPIFDMNNNKIGQAFRYIDSMKDYSKYILEEESIKCMIKLYYLNHRLKIKFNKKYNQLSQEMYYIINEDYLKEIRDYSSIENRLYQIDITNELNAIMNSQDRETKFDALFDGKKFSIIIKNILSEKNIINDQNEINQIALPNFATFSSNGLDFFYYDNFRLIDCLLYEELKENNILFYKNIKSIVSCIIIETYILINIANNNNSSGYGYIAEICEINEQNIIKPIYLLAYDEFKYLSHHLNYVLNIFGNFKGFLESLSFSQGNGIKLNLESSNGTLDVGFIYKISGVLSNQNISQNIPNNNMNNISINNSNIINFSNPSININLSVPINIPNAQINNSINNNNSNNNIISFSPQIIVPPPIPNSPPPNPPSPIPIPPPPPIPDPIIIDSIEKEFTIPPLKGLKNVGATCYMNATLQCFCNIKQFVNYFKYKFKDENLKKLSNEKKVNLTSSFKYLIENIWQTPGNKYINPKNNTQNANNKYYIPIRFKERISIMNPLFEGAQANDAKDLVNFMIMTLHEELNKAPKNQNINSSNLLINQSNKQDVFNNFILTFARENISLISDLFYAVNNNITECLNCGNQKYNYQIYFFLNFPLEEVRKFKIDNNQFIQANQIMMSMNPMFCQQNFINNNQIINSVNLDDCFRYNQKIENFSGENSMYCNNCQTQSPAVYKTILTTGPEILIIILNRGKGIQFKVKCEFVSQLNLYEYIEMKNTGFMYDLIGVVTHIGEHGPSGHFIAYCRSPIDNNWYQYNDDLVFPVKDFVNEVINYAMPYILFYQKIK